MKRTLHKDAVALLRELKVLTAVRENVRKNPVNDRLYQIKTASGLIFASFNWAKSKEGDIYWQRVYKTAIDLESKKRSEAYKLKKWGIKPKQ